MRRILNILPYRIGEIPANVDMDLFKKYLTKLDFLYDKLIFKMHNQIVFVDCGENLKSVKCNHCYSDISEWWANAMLESSQYKHVSRLVMTPCCEKESLLEELLYEDEVGFSKFVIEITNPTRTFSEYELSQISDIFICDMRQLQAFYSK